MARVPSFRSVKMLRYLSANKILLFLKCCLKGCGSFHLTGNQLACSQFYTHISVLRLSVCHVDITLINMHKTHKISTEGHDSPNPGSFTKVKAVLFKVIASYKIACS